MILLNEKLVNDNEKQILSLLGEYAIYPDTMFRSHMWLTGSPQKRAVYNLMYGDYLYNKTGHKILDVGGGYSSLTRLLVENTARYSLIEPFYGSSYSKIPIHGKITLTPDWYNHNPEEYDVVFANDLFPNVDQRLRIFLEKYMQVSHRIVMSLTFHNNPRFYDVVRKGGDEHMCMLAYTGENIRGILRDYIKSITDPDFTIFKSRDSVFHNGRQVCIVEIEGDI